MARNPSKVRELAIQIAALEPADRIELLRLVTAPEEDFERLVESLHRRNRSFSPRAIARDVNLAVREVRSKRT